MIVLERKVYGQYKPFHYPLELRHFLFAGDKSHLPFPSSGFELLKLATLVERAVCSVI